LYIIGGIPGSSYEVVHSNQNCEQIMLGYLKDAKGSANDKSEDYFAVFKDYTVFSKIPCPLFFFNADKNWGARLIHTQSFMTLLSFAT
jgi:hypothetical protein